MAVTLEVSQELVYVLIEGIVIFKKIIHVSNRGRVQQRHVAIGVSRSRNASVHLAVNVGIRHRMRCCTKEGGNDC